jgi:hypothetical protein
MNSTQPRKRPIGVWIITLYFAVTIPFVLYGLYLMLSDQVPMNDAQAVYVSNIDPLDITATVMIGISNVIVAISRFNLRKAALTFFGVSLAINIALTFWHLATKGFVEVVGGAAPIVLGFVLLLSIIAYTAYLSKKRILR